MMSDIPIKEKEITPVVRLSAKIPRINLEVLCKHLDGEFTNPDCPNRFIAIWRGHKIIFTRNEIRMMVPLSLKEKIKEDLWKFVNEELEWPMFKREIGLE